MLEGDLYSEALLETVMSLDSSLWCTLAKVLSKNIETKNSGVMDALQRVAQREFMMGFPIKR